jgi:mRNA-degrading endonuclease RelE of RelBE toxin-antitoxin system
MGKITVTVFIPEEVKEDLKKLAESEQRSLSQMAAILIQQGLDKAKAERKIQ